MARKKNTIPVLDNPGSKMTKRDFEEMFKLEVLPEIQTMYEQDGVPDKPARREEWNNLVDAYIQDGLLPQSAEDWSHPSWLETYQAPAGRRYNPENLVEYADVYRDGDLWVVVETGQPQDNVLVGVGETLADAYENRSATPMQSTGRDSGLSAALEWAEGMGWIAGPLEEVDDAYLESDEWEDNPTGYHVYAEDGFESAHRSLKAAEKAAKRGSKDRKMTYEVVSTGSSGRTGGGEGYVVAVFRNGREVNPNPDAERGIIRHGTFGPIVYLPDGSTRFATQRDMDTLPVGDDLTEEEEEELEDNPNPAKLGRKLTVK